jgi:uncharacterized protein (TIGR02145 family)
MKNVLKNPGNLLTLATMAMAMAMVSCTDGVDDAPPASSSFCVIGANCLLLDMKSCFYNEGSVVESCPVSSSSSLELSSSSISACANPSSYGPFNTVTIGGQTWMAENLNYPACGSKCYDNDLANCAKYGRLYDWVTAMALPASCATTSCASQINAKHRGICPEGWHVPITAEWEQLSRYVDGNSGAVFDDGSYSSYTAGRDLKATSESGDDKYGFAALLGGYGYSGGFTYVYNQGAWWSASEDMYNSNSASFIRMFSYNETTGMNHSAKSVQLSVRCVKDVSLSSSSLPVSSSSSSLGSSSSSSSSSACTAANNTATSYCSNGTMKTYGSVSDGSRAYKTVAIGTQTWMAENLNYNATGSVCYNFGPTNCAKYGRLYDWATAMALPASCNAAYCTSQINAKHRGICPVGWHIPSMEEWGILKEYVNTDNGSLITEGKYLKATSGWNNWDDWAGEYSGNGEDKYGFAALPGGDGYSGGTEGTRFGNGATNSDNIGVDGSWWSSTDNSAYASSPTSSFATYWALSNGSNRSYEVGVSSYALNSVRCLQD